MSLVGRWRKLDGGDCARRYPEEIEFGETRFLAQKGPDQDFVVWDVGGYEVLGDGEVQLQDAADEHVRYALALADDTATFVDAAGCRFSYRRIE
jgi:hypothetical protein